MSDFVPANDIEIALGRARAGQLPMPAFLRVLVESDPAVPSATEVLADGSGFQLLLFDKNATKMVACFTAQERIRGFEDRTPYCLVIKGREFLRRIPPGFGLVINPGLSVGFDITPAGLANIVRDFT